MYHKIGNEVMLHDEDTFARSPSAVSNYPV
jgi:hypothetical protein